MSLCLAFPIGLVVYIIILFITKSIDDTDKYIFKNMWNKRFKKLDLKILGKKTRYVDLELLIEELNKNQSSEHAIFLLKKK